MNNKKYHINVLILDTSITKDAEFQHLSFYTHLIGICHFQVLSLYLHLIIYTRY